MSLELRPSKDTTCNGSVHMSLRELREHIRRHKGSLIVESKLYPYSPLYL
jgi:hypothetical protein